MKNKNTKYELLRKRLLQELEAKEAKLKQLKRENRELGKRIK